MQTCLHIHALFIHSLIYIKHKVFSTLLVLGINTVLGVGGWTGAWFLTPLYQQQRMLNAV